MMVETPIHISNVGMLRNIKESVDSNNKIVSFEVKPIREKQELIHYLTKEVTEQNSDCIDEKNTFIKKQMNVFSNPETVKIDLDYGKPNYYFSQSTIF